MPETVAFELDARIKTRLERLAKARRRSMASLLREAIRQYVIREERRERFDRDALSALREYEETGLHVTQEEMEAWFARLEAGENAEPPKPHT
jgi:predicted transcriptional regulator